VVCICCVFIVLCFYMSLHNTVAVASRLQTGWLENHDLFRAHRIMIYFEHIEWFVSSLLHPDRPWSTESAVQWIQRAYSSWCITWLLIVICCWGEWCYMSTPHTYLHTMLLDLIKLGGYYRDHLLQYHEPLHFGTWCVYVCVFI